MLPKSRDKIWIPTLAIILLFIADIEVFSLQVSSPLSTQGLQCGVHIGIAAARSEGPTPSEFGSCRFNAIPSLLSASTCSPGARYIRRKIKHNS